MLLDFAVLKVRLTDVPDMIERRLPKQHALVCLICAELVPKFIDTLTEIDPRRCLPDSLLSRHSKPCRLTLI